ncbi:MAG: hypothetical protein Q8O28_05940 [Smithellaceae bacterium]|nr:hypothetical protein [Smithellaceae bacterium]
MKKLTMILITVLMVAGLAASAFADPGWSNGQRYGNRDGYGRPHYQYNDRDYRDYRDYRNQRDQRGPYWRPVIIHRVPVRPPEPVAYFLPPPPPPLRIFFPHLNLLFR